MAMSWVGHLKDHHFRLKQLLKWLNDVARDGPFCENQLSCLMVSQH